MEKNKAAVELGRLGDLARNSHPNQKRITEIARKAAKARWVKRNNWFIYISFNISPSNFFPQRSHHQPSHSPIYKPSR